MLSASGDNHVLCAIGATALSDFKLNQLRSRLKESASLELSFLKARFCYFLSTDNLSELTNCLASTLALIDAEHFDAKDFFQHQSVLVVPRLGTKSPWSTKATEIFRRCGMTAVNRIERGVIWRYQCEHKLNTNQKHQFELLLHDRMVESVLSEETEINQIFEQGARRATSTIDVMANGLEALDAANKNLGLALSSAEVEYLYNWCLSVKRNPTETELMMFSQVNSEHCRHKIFNSSWKFDGVEHSRSMFSMIRETHRKFPGDTLVAYEDNAAVIAGRSAHLFAPVGSESVYEFLPEEPAHIVFKAETHNHPTAISPFPGAATGAGGEIRDEGATGIGGKPKAGICGFSVSHLRIPDYSQPWEMPESRPDRIASPLQIMLEGPIGAASFNNEFGRPNIGGYFRTFEIESHESNTRYGYHKPIMFAGGIGNIRPQHISKRGLSKGSLLVVIGGPAMLIGLGGGAASSLGQGSSDEALDYASVQRSNPEMQRRCQETIDRCREMGDLNPIQSIHDVGAGGLSNALPEIVHDAGKGAKIRLNDIPVDDVSMSPMEIWCNEAQERYVLAIEKADVQRFSEICQRENCPWRVIGEVVSDDRFLLQDDAEELNIVDVSLKFLLGDISQPIQVDNGKQRMLTETQPNYLSFEDCVERTLRFPSVADKSFLITIGDRTVSGLIHRDQMVGPWQVPVADAAVTNSDYVSYSGEAMAIGERSPMAVVDESASVRMAIGEALTNLRSTSVSSLDEVRVCANWMASAGETGECKALYEAVQAVSLELCMALGISIPVGKDSLSMTTKWTTAEGNHFRVSSPVSLVASAFTPVNDVRKSLTPQLRTNFNSSLLLIDLGSGKNRMGMSVLHQSLKSTSGLVPDVDDASILKNFFSAVGDLIDDGLILAYHDRSDGGLLASLCEMSFAGRVGVNIQIHDCEDPVSYFFNEELGAIVQIEDQNKEKVSQVFEKYSLDTLVKLIGNITNRDGIKITVDNQVIYSAERTQLHRIWSELTYRMQALRDNPDDALNEYDRILDVADPGLSFNEKAWNLVQNSEDAANAVDFPFVNSDTPPKIAILREQGVNGHVEMAAAFKRAGFEPVDVVMVDLTSGGRQLSDYSGIVMCGGFSFGDVLGAGRGWASLILRNSQLRDMFESFFSDTAKFALGVCNGCQVMAELKEIIPGAKYWPSFVRNQSEQFEARLVLTEILDGKSILTQGMQGAVFPVAVAHGEGRVQFDSDQQNPMLVNHDGVCLRYVDNRRRPTQLYPFNPNGSSGAIAGITNSDGRITAMMPHPERVFRMVQYSWAPNFDKDDSPWMKLFRNAKEWVA